MIYLGRQRMACAAAAHRSLGLPESVSSSRLAAP
eukprot:SAG11_NODE_19733_length_460_cov_0.570637_1_plen_33_part_01